MGDPQAESAPLLMRAGAVLVGDVVERAVVAPPEQRVRARSAGVLPLVGAGHPEAARREDGGHVGGRFGQGLVLHRHEHRGQGDTPAGAEHLREVGPQVGAVTEALIQTLRVVGGLLGRRLPGVEIEPERHLASGYQGEFLPATLDPDPVQRSTEVLDGLHGGHLAVHLVRRLLGDATCGGQLEGPPLVETEISKRHGSQCRTQV